MKAMPDASYRDALETRFGDYDADPAVDVAPASWSLLAKHGSCRAFTDRPVAQGLLDTLAALALSAPTKSDLQQRDIVLITDLTIRKRIDTLLTGGPLGQAWIAGAPAMVVICGNNRRQRQIHEQRGIPFANAHLDAFFNAAVDAGIALSTFVVAAEAVGLGCTPISAVRNHAAVIGDLIGLPDYVFPVAGLGLGWPARESRISPRLPLSATVHRDRFCDDGIGAKIEAYDRRRDALQPFARQRATDVFGTAAFYGWSEDKARQYGQPERADWGAYVRRQGFELD